MFSDPKKVRMFFRRKFDHAPAHLQRLRVFLVVGNPPAPLAHKIGRSHHRLLRRRLLPVQRSNGTLLRDGGGAVVGGICSEKTSFYYYILTWYVHKVRVLYCMVRRFTWIRNRPCSGFGRLCCKRLPHFAFTPREPLLSATKRSLYRCSAVSGGNTTRVTKRHNYDTGEQPVILDPRVIGVYSVTTD